MSGQIRFSLLMAQYLDELLERHHVHGRQALDLACGTGTMAILLADQGWDVTGLDRSPAMLTRAQAKLANITTVGSVTLLQGDMCHPISGVYAFESSMSKEEYAYHIPSCHFDLITCFYDSLNYILSKADLRSCFHTVAQLLKPEGLFIVDTNTQHFLEQDWEPYQIVELPGYVQVLQSSFNSVTHCSTMTLTGFVGDDTTGYQRFDETHTERAHTVDTLYTLFEEAGLQVEACYDCFTFQPIYATSQRIAWIVRKL
ncbi:MAG: class I SAM-dependent methyltransferase [Chloroflexi bacterium AL-W]|nr:class I SAM-dependent methyltransferase [Chloroflexi bacterium AL-N1]NOK69828.1 class I SAM-dependent methyltransferase [Chloroflexi bacterium AL-N10]NOK73568.1 class I SAM-dependent methyltransferase [Chloroflexi bacterium AL-N5]NOK83998.1 class I SAM-dependent methyltransferase [Chloroflexi bacterium AL-W]NOK87899.1 class I SAM-dependent methyltransferase [Chloroflexi bacterium AL-N15]